MKTGEKWFVDHEKVVILHIDNGKNEAYVKIIGAVPRQGERITVSLNRLSVLPKGNWIPPVKVKQSPQSNYSDDDCPNCRTPTPNYSVGSECPGCGHQESLNFSAWFNKLL